MADAGDWAVLPSVLIVEIYSYLPQEDRLAASVVCRRWRACLFHPSLWSDATLELNCGERLRSNFLANRCGRFVKQAVVRFNSRSITEVRECLRILHILSENKNLESFSLQPSSCHIDWPDNEFYIIDSYLNNIEKLIRTARHLRHFSMGCVEQLMIYAPGLLPALARRHARVLQSLHLASVKEDSERYDIMDLSPTDLAPFCNLQILSLDYDNVTAELLLSLTKPGRSPLKKLGMHVHGVEPDHPHIDNATWQQLREACPQLEVTLTLVHSYEGVGALLSILQPCMPLVALRQYFCSRVNAAAIFFLGNHMSDEIQSLEILEGMSSTNPVCYESFAAEDPFVMLAWRCNKLKTLRLIGLEMSSSDLIAITRLRGSHLEHFDIPLSCISHSMVDSDWEGSYGSVPLVVLGEEVRHFSRQVSDSLGREWWPLSDRELPNAILNSWADAEKAYMSILLADQYSPFVVKRKN